MAVRRSTRLAFEAVAVLCLVCLLFMDETKDHDFSDGIPHSAALTIDHADRSTTTQ